MELVKLKVANGFIYLNADHILIVKKSQDSFDNESIVQLDISDKNGKLISLYSPDPPDEIVEKVCGEGWCYD